MAGRLLPILALGFAALNVSCGSSDQSDWVEPLTRPVDLLSLEVAGFDYDLSSIRLDLLYDPAVEQSPDVSCSAIDIGGVEYKSPFSFAVLEPGRLRKHIEIVDGPDGEYDLTCVSGSTSVSGSILVARPE